MIRTLLIVGIFAGLVSTPAPTVHHLTAQLLTPSRSAARATGEPVIPAAAGGAGSLAISTAPAACTLLIAKDASALAGATVTAVATAESFHCSYQTAAGPTGPIVEITVREYPNADSAHAAFPRWVLPYARSASPPTTSPIGGVGDEATIVRTPPQVGVAGIYFRRGAVLVKIGTHNPPATDTALKAAAITAVSRL